MMEALEPLVGGSIIGLDPRSALLFCSDLAKKHLESFFATEKPFHSGLPLTVETWARREIAAFGKVELAVRPPQPLIARRGEATLHIRLARIRDSSAHLLLLRADDPTLELVKLSPLQLGVRATQVLYWLAKGKTNEEIGIILEMATETVKTHLKKIFWRLHFENRSTAASMVTEFQRKTSLNNRAPEDQGKLRETLESHQRYAPCTNAGPGRRKCQIYFSNMKTKNALKFD